MKKLSFHCWRRLYKLFSHIKLGQESIILSPIPHCAAWIDFENFRIATNITSSSEIPIFDTKIPCEVGNPELGLRFFTPLQIISKKSTFVTLHDNPRDIDQLVSNLLKDRNITALHSIKYRLIFAKEFISQLNKIGGSRVVFFKDPGEFEDFNGFEQVLFNNYNNETIAKYLKYTAGYFEDEEFVKYLELCNDKTIGDFETAIMCADDCIKGETPFKEFMTLLENMSVESENKNEFIEKIFNIYDNKGGI